MATVGDVYKRMLIPHRSNGKTSMRFTPRVQLKHSLRDTIKEYYRPELMLWDDMNKSMLNFTFTIGIPPKPKSLALLDAEDILTRTIMEDDCTWKQSQVAIWCNKHPRRWRKP